MKIRVALVFGGVSVEHEISIITANQAYHALDKNKYEVIPVYIDKNSNMYTGDLLLDLNNYKNIDSVLEKCNQVYFNRHKNNCYIKNIKTKFLKKKFEKIVDIALPIMHGTNGEDGSIAGFFEILRIPYVGPSVLSGAVGQDKVIMKQLLLYFGLPVLPFKVFNRFEWIKDNISIIETVSNLGFPVIIKPASLGSSVGVGVANNSTELEKLLHEAFALDTKIIVEQLITDLKEINCSVLGNYENLHVSEIEEVYKTDEFLSYKDKYQGGDKGSVKGMVSVKRKIPASVTDEQKKRVEHYAKSTFQILNSQGVARIDFLINNEDDCIYINEINTIPGALSYYLWEKTFTFTELLDKLIGIALDIKREKNNTIQMSENNILKDFKSFNKNNFNKLK